jgi:TetR/AcrR family fatty acid metabolism transcriptional regulator
MNDDSFRRQLISTSRSKKSDKRARILDAAVEVFAQRGFFHARVSDVAHAAGVAGGTIYLYFKNKDDLLINLFEDRMEAILVLLRAELATLDSASARLRRMLDLHLSMVSNQPALAEVFTVEVRQSAKFMREYTPEKFVEYLGLLEQILEEGCASGEFRPDVDPKVLKLVLFGALDEVSLFWIRSRRDGLQPPYDLKRAADEIWALCTASLVRDTAVSTASDRQQRS